MSKINYPDIPKYKKVNFRTVENLIEIFEEPLNQIGLTIDNAVEVIDDLRKYYEKKDYLFFYHICWQIEEICFNNHLDLGTKESFYKDRPLRQMPHTSKMYSKMFDYFIENMKKKLTKNMQLRSK